MFYGWIDLFPLCTVDFDYPSLEDEQPRSMPKSTLLSSQVKSSHALDINGQTSTPSEPAFPEANPVKCVPSVDRSSKPKQPTENSAPKHNLHSLPATSNGSVVTPLDISEANREIIPMQKPNTKMTNINKHSSSASSTNDSNPANAHRDTLSPNLQPVIPHRSLKPSSPNNIHHSQNTIKATHQDGTNVSIQHADDLAVSQVQSDKLASDKTFKDTDGNESNTQPGEISRKQQEHQIREQQARQELENMRQEKIRTENKQLRLEKAEMEKQLEEQVGILTLHVGW